jgi:hypothetical protein
LTTCYTTSSQSKEIALFWDSIIDREKRRATKEHDHKLLEQVRKKHVSLGEADADRVQRENEKGIDKGLDIREKLENKNEEPQDIENQIRPSENLSEKTTLEQQSILPEESLPSTKVSFSV